MMGHGAATSAAGFVGGFSIQKWPLVAAVGCRRRARPAVELAAVGVEVAPVGRPQLPLQLLEHGSVHRVAR